MSGRRVLILSYYFYPASDVGAKRMSELARRLRDGGWEVVVVTAARDCVPELLERTAGITRVIVAEPPKIYARLAAFLARCALLLKRPQWVAVTAGAGGAPAAIGAPHDAARTARRHGFAAWARRQYHAAEWILDDRKRWSLRAAKRMLQLGRFDWIVSSGPPVSAHVAARRVAARTGARWVMDLRDPWIDNGIWPAEVQSGLRGVVERRMERRCLRRADWITVAAPGIARAIAARAPATARKMEVILNGYDGEVQAAATPSGQLRLLYAGTLYLNRDPFPLLEAWRDLVRTPGVDAARLRLVLVGRCRRWNGRDVAQWVEAQRLSAWVQVLPPVAPAQVSQMMHDAEVLVNFAQGQPAQIPAKLYDYLGAGREMLLIAETDSDAAQVARASGAGRIVAPGDRAGLSAVLREFYDFYVRQRRAFAPRGAVVQFSRDYQNGRFLDLLAAPPTRG